MNKPLIFLKFPYFRLLPESVNYPAVAGFSEGNFGLVLVYNDKRLNKFPCPEISRKALIIYTYK